MQLLGGTARQEDLEQELRTMHATMEHISQSQSRQHKLLLQSGPAGNDATSYGLSQKLDQLRRGV